jgi:hypothetical protein
MFRKRFRYKKIIKSIAIMKLPTDYARGEFPVRRGAVLKEHFGLLAPPYMPEDQPCSRHIWG